MTSPNQQTPQATKRDREGLFGSVTAPFARTRDDKDDDQDDCDYDGDDDDDDDGVSGGCGSQSDLMQAWTL